MEVKSNLVEAHIVRIKNNTLEFLLMQRADNQKYPNIWQMVTGKIKKDELAYETAKREIFEETNLVIENLFVVPNVNHFYDSNDNSMNLVPVFVTKVKYDSEIIISDEHQKYEWLKKKEAKKRLAWPGQSKSVNIIYEYFNNKTENLNFIEINI